MSGDLRVKYERLSAIIGELGSVVIGYSGGVDSTLLIRVANDVLGDRALAVIGRSATYPSREYEEAVRIALALGVNWMEVSTDETDLLKFRENPANRCYYCKTELFGKLHRIAAERGIAWIADGAITDDLDDFRPGRKAGQEQQVRSPLVEAGLCKEEVRELSRELGLPTWQKGSFACLSSRFPYGMQISIEALGRVDAAENLLRDMGFRDFRVRFHDDKTARIEVGQDEIGKAASPQNRARIVTHLKNLGFHHITLDLQGFRSGSMNETLSIPALFELPGDGDPSR